MRLDVPLIRQPKDSVDCVICGVGMLLAYHGQPKDFQRLKSEIATDATGSYAPQLGSYLSRQGFDVEITSLHPKLFTRNDIGASQDEILQRFQFLAEKEKIDQNKLVINHFIDFMKTGGIMTPKIPCLDDILQELKANRPLGALMTTRFLTDTQPKFNFHFVVITGYEEGKVYVNDPMWDEAGGRQAHDVKEFFYGLYASAFGDLDNACLIKVRPR